MLDIPLEHLITYNPTTVTVETTVDEVVRLMCQYGIHHLPVIDDDFALIGVVSDLDVARVIEHLPSLQRHATADAALLVAAVPSVAEMLLREVQFVSPQDSPAAALRLMLHNGFHSVPVAREGRLEGIITSTDYLRELSYNECALARSAVALHMHSALPSLDVAATFDEMATAMLTADGYAIVFDGDRPRAILSDRQRRRAYLNELLVDVPWLEDHHRPQRRAERAADLLPADEFHLVPEQTLATAAHELFERRVQGALVLNHDRRLCGVLTETDVLSAMLNVATKSAGH